jgi:hypothetical protein
MYVLFDVFIATLHIWRPSTASLICGRMIHCEQKSHQKANACNNFPTPAMLNNINNRISIHEQQINYGDKFWSIHYYSA